MLISSIALQVYCVAQLWRRSRSPTSKWYLLGGILHTAQRASILLYALNAAAYSIVVGGVLAIYGVVTFSGQVPVLPWSGRRGRGHRRSRRSITGPLVAFPGAAIAIWCSTRGWDKVTQRCVYPAIHSHHAGSDTGRSSACLEKPNRST